MKVYLSKFIFVLMTLFLGISTSCSSDKDDVKEEAGSVNVAVNFSYVFNFQSTPKFAKSCSLWVFDESGKLVESFFESGEKVASKDYTVNLSLPEGRYDFVTWFGIEEESLVKLVANPPASIEDLSLQLQLDFIVGGPSETFSSDLPVIYNGHLTNVEIKQPASTNVARKITISLLRDSKTIDIRLIGLINEIKDGEFRFKITNGCNLITWNNSLETTETFYYRPMNEREYEIIAHENSEYADLKVKFSTFPLSVDSDHRLIITRSSDNTEILNISLVEALLKDRPIVSPDVTDEEYLERKDSFYLIIALNGKH